MNEKEYTLYLESKSEFANGNYQKGIQILEDLAKKRNKNAIYDLGMISFKGLYGMKNLKKAVNLLLLSGDLGFKEAYFQLGKLYYEEYKNIEEAERFFLKCNDGKSKFYIGLLNYHHLSKEKAVSYFYYASKCHYHLSEYYLAKCYIDGEGTKVNMKKGSLYLSLALENNIEDIFNLKDKLNRYKCINY